MGGIWPNEVHQVLVSSKNRGGSKVSFLIPPPSGKLAATSEYSGSDPNGGPCTVDNIYVTLPVRANTYNQNFETTDRFD
jgi:hypothetical protein